jgi:hypothetical protein
MELVIKIATKYRTVAFITNKTLNHIYRLIALIIVICIFICFPLFSILGLVVFYTIFWTRGIFEYALYLMWVDTFFS